MVHDLVFRALYISVIIEMETRRIVHTAVTRSPGDIWEVVQRTKPDWEDPLLMTVSSLTYALSPDASPEKPE